MNKNNYRLVFSRLRNMLVAVEETATTTGKEAGQSSVRSGESHSANFTLRQIAFAALVLLGVLPSWSSAQIVPGGANAPGVIATQNGLPQVNINRPSGAGVSMNTYGQFDVQKNGAILNNSPTIVQTQQAGMINGNPNFGPGQAARVVVNQVNSSAASQINGRLEVAGQRAEVVIANGSGISVNGGGFINTSRAILTTGTPNFAPDGSLSGFNVTHGNISVQGAGLNAADIDQVDLIARAVQANAAIYAKNLNVVTGANSVNHDTLNATPIAGEGLTPGVSIDVSNLGGMYSNRIVLVGTENGIGVSTKGVLAAQAGDLILTTQGKLVLAGQTNASGNMALAARDGIENSGTTYAQQNVSATTSGALTNSGVLAAQQNTTVHAGSVASTGTLGAGVNSDGTIANEGDLSISAIGAITATGQNEAGGNTNISGASVNLAGSNTSANGTLALAARGGDLNVSSASTTAGNALIANAAGTLINDNGKMSGASVQATAANVSNRSGQLVSGSTLNLSAANGVSNQGGTMQSAGALAVNAGSLDNTAGRIVSLNGDGLDIASDALNNGANGTIGTNGALNVHAGTLSNQGQLTAAGNAVVHAQSIDNHAGSIVAGHVLDVTATGVLNNSGATLSGSTTTVSGSSIDNSNGNIEGDALAVSATGNIANHGGKLTQFGTADQAIQAGGTLDNTSGAIASNGNNLRIDGQTITNDKGNIQHAGTGTLAVNANGGLSNVAGNVLTNGALAARVAGGLDNTQGAIQASRRADVNAASLDNTAGRIGSLNGDGLGLGVTGALVNGAGGTVGTNGALDVIASTVANQGKLTAAGDVQVRAQSFDNHAGTVTAGGALTTTIAGALDNAAGTLSGSTTTVSGSSIDNSNGDIEGDALAISATGNIANRGGKLTQFGTTDQSIQVGGTLDNADGTIATNAQDLSVSAQSITNDHGALQHAGTGKLSIKTPGGVSNGAGQLVTNGAMALHASGALNNNSGAIQAARGASVDADSLDNTAGRIVSLNDDGLSVTATDAFNNGSGGTIGTNGTLDVDAGMFANQGTLTAAQDARVHAKSIDNHAGTITAGGALGVATGWLNNTAGTLSGGATAISAASVDNTNGDINGDALALSISGDLTNQNGALIQYSTADQSIQVGGTLDNTDGTIATNARNLSASAQSITNEHGTIQHAGTGTLSVTSAGAVSNIGGSAQTNGALTVTGASLDNTSGTLLAMQAAQIDVASGIVNRDGSLYGGNGLAVSTQGDLDNTRGSAQTSGDLSVSADGAITNAQGTISANGAHGTASVSAASIDNAGGKLTNAGDGATTINASDVRNTGGTLGGNGDVTVTAQTLSNDAGANLVAGGAANLNVTRRVDNSGGTLFGGTALNLNQVNADVINDGGAMLGGQDVSVNVASISNAAGAIRANRDIAASGAVSGDGDMIAGRDLALAVVGDYTNTAANTLHADGNMTVSATGTLTNTGTLAANGALTASGANVVNSADGDINSASTIVNASNAITNAGRIEGDTVTTNSATLANTGAVIGNDVTVNAADITNTGAAAVIAGANSVHLYASDSVTNADGALLYSLGNLEIAKDGTRDASGMLANQTGTLTNSAASIEAEGDIDIAARTVNNVRTGVLTEAGTPQDAGSTTLTIWTAGLTASRMGYYYSTLYPEWRWDDGAIGTGVIGHLMKPITVTLPASQVTNLDPNAQSFSLTVPLTDTYSALAGGVTSTRTITNNATQWYNSLTDNGNGTYSITFWPDFDPNKNIRPDQLRINEALGNDNHDYVEMSHTTQTTTTTDQLVSAGNAAAARANAEQNQQIQQQRAAQQRDAAVQAPAVRSTLPTSQGFPLPPKEDPCFRIDTFRLDVPTTLPDTIHSKGASALPLDPFAFAREWLDHYKGECIGKAGIDTLTKALQQTILSRGYVTTRLLLPEQDLSKRTLTLALVPGVVRQIRFADPNTRGTLRSAFPARDGDLLDLRDLEQGLEQMKRVASQDVDMKIEPTGNPGESDVIVTVKRSKPWSFVASIDNSGTDATGKWQGNVSLGIDNPLGLNDVFTAGANQDLSFGNKSLGSHGFNGSYSVPWGYWIATLSGNTNTYYQQIAGVNQTFVSSGNSQTATLRLARVLSRSQSDVFGVEFQLSKRFGQSFIDDTDIPQQRRNNTFIEAGLTDRHYFGASQFDGTLAYRHGIGGLGATDDPFPSGPTYRFHIAVLDGNLSVPFAVARQTFRYVTTVHGQFTNDALFYLDDLTIGSRYTVRGFDGETMLAAERGFFWRNELQWPVFKTGQMLYAGIDYGRVFGPNTAFLAGTQLAGAVIGIRGGLPARVVGLSYDLFVGTPLYKPSGFPTSRVTVGMQAIAQF